MYRMSVQNQASIKIYMSYHITLNLIILVTASTKFIPLQYHKYPWIDRIREKTIKQGLNFTSIRIERTVTQRGRSISKLVRYYFKNVGNILSSFQVYCFHSFFIYFAHKIQTNFILCVGSNRNLARCDRSTTTKTWYVSEHKIWVF